MEANFRYSMPLCAKLFYILECLDPRVSPNGFFVPTCLCSIEFRKTFLFLALCCIQCRGRLLALCTPAKYACFVEMLEV